MKIITENVCEKNENNNNEQKLNVNTVINFRAMLRLVQTRETTTGPVQQVYPLVWISIELISLVSLTRKENHAKKKKT